MGDTCNYCGGQGTVVDHGQTQVGWQKSAGGGTLTCPRCYGTGVNGGNGDGTGDNAPAVGGKGLGYLLGYTLGPPLIIAGIGGAIAYNIFGTELSGWVGAGIGFGVAMLNKSWRKEFLSMMSKIIIGGVILVIIIFVFDAFFGDEPVVSSKDTPDPISQTLSKKQITEKAIRDAVKGNGITAKSAHQYNFNPTEEEAVKMQCEGCVDMLNRKIANSETRNIIEKNCGEIKQKCNKYSLTW